MSGSPRSHTSQTAIFALAIGAAIIGLTLILLALGINVLEAGGQFVGSLYPPIAVTTEGAQIRDLYTVVFIIAVVIFLVVEGLIIWTVIRYRRKPTDVTLPPQTHGNNIAEFVWTVVPTIIVIFMFIVSWQTLNAVDTSSPTPQTKIRAVAGQFQWQFEYLSQDGNTVLYTEQHPAGQRWRRDDGPGRADGPAPAVRQPEGRDPRLLRPAIPVQARRRAGSEHLLRLHRRRGRRRPDVPRPVRGAVRRRSLHHAVRGQGADRHRFRRLAGRQGRRRPTRRRPRPRAAARRPAAARAGETLQVSAPGIKYEQTSLTAKAGAPFQIEFDNQDKGSPHNVAIHQGSPTGTEVFKGEIFTGVATKVYDVPALDAGELCIRLHGPSDDDRHADGPVRSHRWRRPR